MSAVRPLVKPTPGREPRAVVSGIAGEALYRFGGRAFGGVLSLIALHVAVTHFGAARWGVFAAAFAWASTFAVLGELGIAAAAARDLPHAGNSAASTLGATYVLGAIGSLVAAAVAAGVGAPVYARHPEVRTIILVLLPMFPFSVLWVTAGTLLSANGRNDLRAALDVLSSAAMVIVAVTVVNAHLGLVSYGAGTAIVTCVTASLGVVLLRHLALPAPSWASLRPAVLDRLRVTKLVSFVTVVVLVYRYVDTVMLSLLSRSVEVGRYAVAYQLAGFLLSMPGFVLAAGVTRYVAGSADDRERLMSYLTDRLLIVFAPIAGFLAVLAGPLLAVVGGGVGRSAHGPFELLLIACAFSFVAAPFVTALIWRRDDRYAAAITAISLTLNVVTNLALDRRYGADGAAFSMIVSEVFTAFAAYGAYRRRTGFRLRRGLSFVVLGVTALGTTSAVFLR